jgi:hypothetical protein
MNTSFSVKECINTCPCVQTPHHKPLNTAELKLYTFLTSAQNGDVDSTSGFRPWYSIDRNSGGIHSWPDEKSLPQVGIKH